MTCPGSPRQGSRLGQAAGVSPPAPAPGARLGTTPSAGPLPRTAPSQALRGKLGRRFRQGKSNPVASHRGWSELPVGYHAYVLLSSPQTPNQKLIKRKRTCQAGSDVLPAVCRISGQFLRRALLGNSHLRAKRTLLPGIPRVSHVSGDVAVQGRIQPFWPSPQLGSPKDP